LWGAVSARRMIRFVPSNSSYQYVLYMMFRFVLSFMREFLQHHPRQGQEVSQLIASFHKSGTNDLWTKMQYHNLFCRLFVSDGVVSQGIVVHGVRFQTWGSFLCILNISVDIRSPWNWIEPAGWHGSLFTSALTYVERKKKSCNVVPHSGDRGGPPEVTWSCSWRCQTPSDKFQSLAFGECRDCHVC
jgi:hypothetical protein